jgi:hypothetical protein
MKVAVKSTGKLVVFAREGHVGRLLEVDAVRVVKRS